MSHGELREEKTFHYLQNNKIFVVRKRHVTSEIEKRFSPSKSLLVLSALYSLLLQQPIKRRRALFVVRTTPTI